MPFARGRKSVVLAYCSIAVPALGWLTFGFYPMALTVFYSLTQYSGQLGSPINFVGLQNYKDALGVFRPELLSSLGASAKYSIFIVIVQNAAGLGLALLLNRRRRSFGFYRALVFLPQVFSVVVVAAMFVFLFDPIQGPMPRLYSFFHIPSSVSFSDPTFAIWLVAAVNVWMYTGFTMIIYIAGLNRIPKSLYEAAAMDGVNKARRFWHITWPLLAPATTVNVFMAAIGSISQFALILVLTNGNNGTRTIGAYMFSTAFGSNSQLGYGSMLAIIQLVMTLGVGGGLLFLLRRRETQL
jgi:raffinose/stachyose/melibiose transport system permease protein